MVLVDHIYSVAIVHERNFAAHLSLCLVREVKARYLYLRTMTYGASFSRKR